MKNRVIHVSREVELEDERDALLARVAYLEEVIRAGTSPIVVPLDGLSPNLMARALRRAGWFVSRDAELCVAALEGTRDWADREEDGGLVAKLEAILAEQEDK